MCALDNVDFTLRAGEVHCLVGENGAGKSTLMKILAGGQEADAGEIRLHDEIVRFRSPHHAQELGLSMIYQEFNLCAYLSVGENILLGRQPRIARLPFIDWAVHPPGRSGPRYSRSRARHDRRSPEVEDLRPTRLPIRVIPHRPRSLRPAPRILP